MVCKKKNNYEFTNGKFVSYIKDVKLLNKAYCTYLVIVFIVDGKFLFNYYINLNSIDFDERFSHLLEVLNGSESFSLMDMIRKEVVLTFTYTSYGLCMTNIETTKKKGNVGV